MRHPDQPQLADALEAFEAAVLAQRPVAAEHYDEEYFAADWRAEGDNRYDLETRRRIEARNPQLIKDVFAPERVLDLGCGPGFLMQFLHELGVDVHGVDYAPTSTELAPPERPRPHHDRPRSTEPHVDAAVASTSSSAARCSST